MLIRLDTLKLAQAAAFVLAKHSGFITRKRLLKLLYIADRELIRDTRRPLTGDHPVAMEHGPVLSRTYDLLKGTATGSEVWNKYILQIAPYTHRLIGDPGVGKLSRAELAKLEEVVERHWWLDDDELSNLTHEFPEWIRNQPAAKGVRPIPVEHVLDALGLSGQFEHLKAEARAEAELDALLAGEEAR